MFLRWRSDVSEKKKVSKSFRKERKKAKNRKLHLIFITIFFLWVLHVNSPKFLNWPRSFWSVLSLRAHHFPRGQSKNQKILAVTSKSMKHVGKKINNRVFKKPSFYEHVFKKITGSVSSELMQLDGNDKVTWSTSVQINLDQCMQNQDG